jgi:hypothetical protein
MDKRLYGYVACVCMAMLFLCYAYYRLYLDKHSYRYLGYDANVTVANHRTQERTVDLKTMDGSQIFGKLTVQEVNGAVVIIVRVHEPISEVFAPMRIFEGHCFALGEKRYTLPSLKAGNTAGWIPMYDVSWKRLVSELPLSFVIQTEDGNSPIACADMHLE